MEIIFVLCLVAATPTVSAGNPNFPPTPYEVELDRARSAWNFGGHYNRQAPWLINRQRQNIPGTVIADRRTGSALPFQPPTPLMPMPVPLRQILQSPSQKLAQQYQYPTPQLQHQVKPKPTPSKISKPKRKSKRPSPKRSKPSKMISPKFAGLERHASRRKAQSQSIHNGNNNRTSRSQPQSSSKSRASRKITSNSRSDTVLEKFRKEDLWHLDKGESYPLKNKDIAEDQHLREYGHSLSDHDDDDDHENEIHDDPHEKAQNHLEEEEVHIKHHHKHEHDDDVEKDSNEIHDETTRHKLEEEAEKVVAQSMKGQPHSSSEGNGKDVQHVHHHHHHHSTEQKNATKVEKKKEKKPEKNKLIPIPIPRIHNPIPLGCLFTVPVFHPIRPRHQLACLLSIPGTPNLHKRRRRSTDSQQQQSSMGGIPGQSQNHQFYQYQPNGNQGMSQYAPLRKAYASHVGGGKAPMPPQSSPVNSNLKVPATIIPPPKFDKADILQMLLGSGGVDMTEIGTVLMSNNRYVRYGRGLPNSSGKGRTGRNLWTARSPQPTLQSISGVATPAVPIQKQQQTIKQFSSVGKPFQSQSQGRSPVVSLTPVLMTMPSSSPASRAHFMTGAAPSKSYVKPFQSQPNRVQAQSQLKPGVGYLSKFPMAVSTNSEQIPKNPYFNTIRNYKYTEWSPMTSLKSNPFYDAISLATEQYIANLLTAESQQQSKTVKSPPLSTATEESSSSSATLTDSNNHNDIDVSDLAEAMGTYRGPTKSKSKSKVKFEKEVKNVSSFPPSTSSFSYDDKKKENKKSNSLKTFSYAVKNTNTKNYDDFNDFANLEEEEDDDDASASNSDKLRFSVLNDYGEEELEVYVPKSKLKFPQIKRIPEPIIINVPKDNSIDRL